MFVISDTQSGKPCNNFIAGKCAYDNKDFELIIKPIYVFPIMPDNIFLYFIFWAFIPPTNTVGFVE